MQSVTLSVFHHRGDKQIKIDFPYSAKVVNAIKEAGATWSNSNRCWYILFTKENHQNIISIFEETKDYLICNLSEYEFNLNRSKSEINNNDQLNEQLNKIIKKYDDELVLKGYSINTSKNYKSDFIRFLKFFREKILKASPMKI